MIPKLCADITDTNGLGRLADVISVSVKQELNGAYELTMTYPITGALYDQIEVDRLIGTRSGEDSGVQYFRIVRISRPINGIVSVYAQHYSYQLNYIHVPPCVVTGTVQSCLDQLKALCIEGCDFTLTSELANVMTVVVEKPTALRSVIGGMDGSILEQLHAEALWDNDTVVIKSALVPTVIGQRNVALRYGKNIADLEAEDSIEAFYSGVLPYWQKEVDGVDVYVQGAIQYSQAQGAFDYERIYPLDLSSDFDDQPTVAQLNAAGASFVTANNVGTITPSITATPAQIWETKEYAALAGIESLRLGSMTDIIYNRLGVNATAEVVETVWDGLLERYSSMTFGEPRASIVNDVAALSSPSSGSKKSGSSALDTIVEEGVSGTWTYRKWSSGISECWGYYDVSNVACTTASGQLYVTGAISPSMAFPSGVFASDSTLNVQMLFHSSQGTPAFVWVAANASPSVGATPFRLMRPTSTTISGRMEYSYRGRWK